MIDGKPNLQNVAGCAIHSDIVKRERMLISAWRRKHQQSLDQEIVKRLLGQTNASAAADSEPERSARSGAFPRQIPKGSSPMFDPSHIGQHHISTAASSAYYAQTSIINEGERYLPPTTWRFGKKGIPHHYGRTLHGVSVDGTDTSYRAH
jgi:hypothetical protein